MVRVETATRWNSVVEVRTGDGEWEKRKTANENPENGNGGLARPREGARIPQVIICRLKKGK